MDRSHESENSVTSMTDWFLCNIKQHLKVPIPNENGDCGGQKGQSINKISPGASLILPMVRLEN